MNKGMKLLTNEGKNEPKLLTYEKQYAKLLQNQPEDNRGNILDKNGKILVTRAEKEYFFKKLHKTEKERNEAIKEKEESRKELEEEKKEKKRNRE